MNYTFGILKIPLYGHGFGFSTCSVRIVFPEMLACCILKILILGTSALQHWLISLWPTRKGVKAIFPANTK